MQRTVRGYKPLLVPGGAKPLWGRLMRSVEKVSRCTHLAKSCWNVAQDPLLKRSYEIDQWRRHCLGPIWACLFLRLRCLLHSCHFHSVKSGEEWRPRLTPAARTSFQNSMRRVGPTTKSANSPALRRARLLWLEAWSVGEKASVRTMCFTNTVCC
jgi:hypothetical protein